MKISEALNLKDSILITLVGGGGKTTTLFSLGEELVAVGKKIVLTTTTSIFMPESNSYDVVIITENIQEAKEKVKDSFQYKRILLGKRLTGENKLKGFSPEEMDYIYEYNDERFFLVEGDGSNGRSLKVPDAHEPQVPALSTITIILIGTDIFGKKINEENVHRHHLLESITHNHQGNVDKDMIIDLISNSLGITKGIPEGSKKIIFFNKIRSTNTIDYVRELSNELLIQSRDEIKKSTVGRNQEDIRVPNVIDGILIGEAQDINPIVEFMTIGYR